MLHLCAEKKKNGGNDLVAHMAKKQYLADEITATIPIVAAA